MNLKSSIPIPWLTKWYSGICLYFSNAICQSMSLSGGMAPRIGFHSVIERPLSVSRVAPPTTIIATMSAAMHHSQISTPRCPPIAAGAGLTAFALDVRPVIAIKSLRR